jgi:hypothetical protein
MLTQKRAENETETRRKLSETRAEIGRIGGVSSGFSRTKANNNNVKGQANASRDDEQSRVEREKIATDDTHARVLAAARIDLSKDVSGKWLSSEQVWRSTRWITDLGLTTDECVAVVAEVTAKRHNGPPGSLAYFDGAMADAARRKAAPPLEPSNAPQQEPRPARNRRTADAERYEAALDELERRVSQRSVALRAHRA